MLQAKIRLSAALWPTLPELCAPKKGVQTSMIQRYAPAQHSHKTAMTLQFPRLNESLLPLFVLLTSALFAQKSAYQVVRCGAVSRSASINHIYVDADNTKWVSSSTGLHRVSACDLGTPVSLSPGEQSALQFAGGNADVRWTPEVLQMVLGLSPMVTAAYYDSDRDWLWLGTEKDGLFQLSTKPAFKLLAKFNASNTKLKTNTITTIFRDRSGRYWIGTDEGMLVGTPDRWKVELEGYNVQRVRQLGTDIYVLADGEFWLAQNGQRWQPINVKEKALEGEAEDFDLDQEGNLWILSRIVSRYSLLSDDFEVFSGAEYFTSEYGLCIAADGEGSIWIGTDDKGIYLISKASALLVNCTVEQEVSCEGNGDDAIVRVNVSGGAPPYRYAWSDAQLQGPNPKNVAIGSYTVTVTDAAGKSKQGKVTVEDKRLTAMAEQRKIESAIGAKDGSAEVKTRGGTPEFRFKWDNGETTNPAVRLSEGQHSVTVTDKRGCSAVATVTIARKIEALTARIEETAPIPCFGGNAILSARVEGGKEPYQYEWSSPKFSGAQVSGVMAGTYTLTVVDALGGRTVTSINVSQPATLSVVATQQAPAILNQANGQAQATARGGTAPYTYTWDNGETTATPTALTAGEHSVTVVDANGCTLSARVVIDEKIPALSATIKEAYPIECFGGKTNLDVSVEGGKSPFQFAWSAPELVGYQPEEAIPAGTYTVTVTDAAGNKTTATRTVRQPEPLKAAVTLTAPAAIASADGRAIVKAQGGTPPYQYRWDSEEYTEEARRLYPGPHKVTVADNNGCEIEVEFTMTENILPLSIRIEETGKIPCAGGTTSLRVDVRGGKPPFEFVWAQPALKGQTPTGVRAGVYQLVVVDAAGGRTSTAFQVLEPDSLKAMAKVMRTADPDQNNGNARAIVSGGTPPYQIRWQNDEIGEDAVRLGAGTFNFTVTDANGCTTAATVTIGETLLPLSVNISELVPIPCHGQKGTLRAHTSGGVRPYNYKWSTGLQGDQPNNAGPGMHILTVTDARGSTASAFIEIKEPPAIIPFAVLQAPASTGKNDGKARAEGRGGTGKLSFAWDNGETTAVVSNLSPGPHTVTVTDERGCSATFTLEVPENILPLTVNIEELSRIQCSGQTTALKATIAGGKPPYQYKWSEAGWSGLEIKNVSAGSYTLTVTDAQGTTQAAVVIVSSPPPMEVEITRIVGATTERSTDGKATLKVSGGTPPITIIWDGGENTPTASKLKLGTHTVTISDALGCSLVKNVEIKKRILPELNAEVLRSGQTIRMEQLRFEADSFNLTPECLPTLDELYDFMEENGNVVIEIGGHTNNIPPDEFCDRLSTARAKAVAEYLIQKGIDPRRVTYKGYGKRQPIASNATPEGRRLNQRVEIKILALKRE